MLVVHDPERVRMQVAAKLADDDGGEPPDHLQVYRAVLVVERGHLVRTSLVGARAHVADQVHLRTATMGCQRTLSSANFAFLSETRGRRFFCATDRLPPPPQCPCVVRAHLGPCNHSIGRWHRRKRTSAVGRYTVRSPDTTPHLRNLRCCWPETPMRG